MKQSNKKRWIAIGAAVLILYLCLLYLPGAMNFLGRILSVSVPLFAGAVIAYIVNLIMDPMEKKFFSKVKKRPLKKLGRVLCMLLSYLIIFAIVALIMWLIIPQLVQCVTSFVELLPVWLTKGVNFFTDRELIPPAVSEFLTHVDWKSVVTNSIKTISEGVTGVMSVLISTVSSVFSFVVTAFLSLIFSAYFLMEKDKILSQIRRLAKSFLAPEVYEKTAYVVEVFDRSFHGYLIGQSVEAVILGCLCALGMLILRIPYAAMVGTLVAFTALIPVAGAYIGAIVGAFMILTVSPVKAFVFVIFLVILQQLEGNLIYPKVVGTSLGLPGIWVLASILIGGGILGIPGMFFGVPIAGALYQILRDVLQKREAQARKEEKEASLP